MTGYGIRVTCTGAGQSYALLVARLDELERKFEENPRRYFAPLANEYRKAGDAGRAVGLCRAHLPEIPGHISGHIVLGQALYDVADYPGSRSALETALALDPENIVALRYLGDIARDTGDAAEATRWYNRTLEADPYSEAAQAGLDALKASASEPLQERQEIEPQPADALSGAMEAPKELTPEFETADEPAAIDGEAPEAQSKDWEFGTVAVDQPPMIEISAEVDAADRPADIAEVPEVSVERLGEREQILESYKETPVAIAEFPEGSADIREVAADIPEASAEFAGDLDVSAVTESTEAVRESTIPETAEVVEAVAIEAPDVVADVAEELVVDVEAHREPETFVTAERSEPAEVAREIAAPQMEGWIPTADPIQTASTLPEESIQAEERVLEAAAPFVTETMADLYMEQGYPHEALELMLQLAEQRPEDESLRLKIGRIESAIVARRDAAVAAARAERAEAAEAEPPTEEISDAVVADAPKDAVAEAQAYAAAAPAPVVAPPAPRSVQELFARMDGSRPRVSPATPQPAPVLRSDFVPIQDTRSPSGAERKFVTGEHRTGTVPRSSGSHQTFDPSTAGIDDFDAWLRGLRGP